MPRQANTKILSNSVGKDRSGLYWHIPGTITTSMECLGLFCSVENDPKSSAIFDGGSLYVTVI